MPHDLFQSTMAYVGEEPWHGLGRRVPASVDAATMIVAASLNWQVRKKPAPGARRLLFVVLNHSRQEGERFDLQKFKDRLSSVESDLCWCWYDTAWKAFKYETRKGREPRYFPGIAILVKK